MQEVNWDAVNLLELGMLLDMAKDGYEFQIADGRIKSIEGIADEQGQRSV